MTTGNKTRIYDLARDKTPEDLDEKSKKKVQAEITRQVIALSPKFGQSPKTASSSIDSGAANDIIKLIDFQQIIEDCQSGKTKARKVTKKEPAEEVKAEEPQKKKIRIVRRLSKVDEEPKAEEATTETEISTEEEKPAEETVDEAQPAKEEAPEEPKHVQEMLANMNKSKQENKPAQKQMSSKKLDSVKSIPLRPQGGGGQPYRVGKPTILPQGMGRKKRRLSPEDRAKKDARSKVKEEVEDELKEIYVTDATTVRELSQKTGDPETEIITYFFMKGIIKTVNESLEKDLAVEYCESKEYLVYTEEDTSHVGAELRTSLEEDETEGSLMQRPPVVTIMGHVDHGKTTLLDSIREAKINVTDKESGGITQHIGAYQVTTQDYDGNDRVITFLDTPGHEAFTAMRKRGANVTDIVILVVAADDGIMPQTIEAIKHTKEAKVPFLIAVNKIDKEGANPDKVLGQLTEHDIVVEQYGGPVVCSMVSALTKQNLDELLEKILLVSDAELDEKIRSNPDRKAIGAVIEAELSRSKGPIATLLVQNGTLRKGDCIAAGPSVGRVRAMFNDLGEEIDEALPSTPVKLMGLTKVPNAGDSFRVYDNFQEAKKAAEELEHIAVEEKRLRGLSVFASAIKEGQKAEYPVIIKADVQGSAEAIAQEINKLSTDEVLVKPIEVSSGPINRSDVELASRTGAALVGFHVGPDTAAARYAQDEGVKIKMYEVIYELTEDVRRFVLGLHEPEKEEVLVGSAEVRQIFTIGKTKRVGGSYVTNGKIVRYEIARVFREGVMIYEGKIDYLKRFKDDAKEVKEKMECGLSFEKYNDLEEGDKIECWTIKEIARTHL